MPVLKSIYRYPIKGLSAQPLGRVEIAAKQPLPHDRVFALGVALNAGFVLVEWICGVLANSLALIGNYFAGVTSAGWPG